MGRSIAPFNRSFVEEVVRRVIAELQEREAEVAETIALSMRDIQVFMAKQGNVSLEEMLSVRRSVRIVDPRHAAMYFCQKLLNESLPAIGRQFGGRDHTTVLHAIHRIESKPIKMELLIWSMS